MIAHIALFSDGLSIVYPFGCTLELQKPALAILSSGALCFPANRSIGAVCKVGQGTLLVLGSVRLFHDEYINKEGNAELLNICLRILTVCPLSTVLTK
jgi:intraflagellar transport protein 52